MHNYQVGDIIRIWRKDELLAPWFDVMSSNGLFIVNYQIGTSVSSDVLGQRFQVVLPIDLRGYISMRQEDVGSRQLGPAELIHHTLIAEVIGSPGYREGHSIKACNCGKDKTGSIGRHSYWCNLAEKK